MPSIPEGTSTATIGRPLRRVHSFIRGDRGACRAVEIARKTGAEQRIDDEIGGFEIDVLERADRTCKAPRRLRRIALERCSARREARLRPAIPPRAGDAPR